MGLSIFNKDKEAAGEGGRNFVNLTPRTYDDIENALGGKLDTTGGTVTGDVSLSGTTNKIGATATDKVGFYDATAVARQNHIANAKTNYTTGDLDTEAEVIAAINATNTTLNSILTAIENIGIVKTA